MLIYFCYLWLKIIRNFYGIGITPTNKRRFNSYININYIRLSQTQNYWFAPGPGLIKLPQNIMYPFKIGTTNYGNANGIKVSGILIYIFIISIFI